MQLLKKFSEKVLFSQITPLVRLGATRPLQEEDLPSLPHHIDPRQVVIDESRITWTSGLSLLKTLLLASRHLWVRQLGFYGLFALMNLLGPVLVNQFVTQVHNGFSSPEGTYMGALYGIGVGLVGLIGGLSLQHYFLRHLIRHQIVTNVVNKKIFTHALDLTKEARERNHLGDIVNHMSADTDAVAEVGNALADMLYCLLMIAGAVFLLHHYLGSTAWVAVVLLSVLAPLTRKVARDFSRFDKDLMNWRDKRVTLMAQILTAARLVKYFVWEDSVSAEIKSVRSRELAARRRIARAELLVTLIYVSAGTFVLFAVLATHAWRGRALTPELIFTCISLFSLLEDPFAFISRSVSQFISGKVAADRIAKFLNEPVLTLPPALCQKASGQSAPSDPEQRPLEPAGLEIKNLEAFVGGGKFHALRDICLSVPAGSSLAVVGAVGSGKSTLLHALLGEIDCEGELYFTDPRGQTVEECRISYVPQEAYILNGSLRENLTFGREDVRQDEIDHALGASALAPDLALIAGGLNAEIGEKGINLSGGQKQRLSLARAILHRPQLVALDDPLSAVDPTTESHLVNHLLFQEWNGVTRVVVTHRLAHLKRFDRIAFLEQGRLIGLGSFAELRASCAPFRAYLEEHDKCEDAGTGHQALAHGPGHNQGEPVRMTEEEDREYGAVSSGMYWDYIKALAGESLFWRPAVLFLLLLSAGAGTLLPLAQKSWLAYVSDMAANSGRQLASSGPGTSESWLERTAAQPLSAILVYGAIGLTVLIGLMLADLYWLKRGLTAGRSMHDRMLKSILGAHIRFFDSTPAGRILQRFSRDMEAVDIHLQWSFEHSMKCFAQVAVTLVLIVIALPAVILPLAPILVIYYRTQKLYRASAREVKRLDSISRSPRYAHFKETLTGLTVIRAYGRREWFLEGFYRRLHHNQRMFYGHYMINRWFSSRIPIIGGLVAIATTISIVAAVKAGQISPGTAGLLTVYSLGFWGVLNWGIRVWSEVEARMTSVERIKFYSSLPQETSADLPSAARPGEKPPASWPSHGEVRFLDVHARYAEHLPFVLKGLSFTAPAGTRVGIVGRTGSGKSTVFQALYRFIDLAKGQILIDGVDIATIPLPRLRRALAIIPQDPTLFMGSLRLNLDRYHEHTDSELWAVLERTALADVVRALPGRLDCELAENGANLSQGQRQLLCLARALLIQAKVIVLDEATASVDVKTDAAVQRVLRESCAGVTMLIIAHRLGTVQDCDQILEIREGRSQESRELGQRAPALADITPSA